MPLKERMVAEAGYCVAFEKALKGPDGVVEAYLACCISAEFDQAGISLETTTLTKFWAEARTWRGKTASRVSARTMGSGAHVMSPEPGKLPLGTCKDAPN